MANSSLLILVVEDDGLVKDIVREALSEGGFESEVVASGEQALAVLQGEHPDYRAVVTDINLQGELTGWDVARRARELNPEIPVVYMSGAAADQWTSHGVPNSLLLQKPFAPAQVVTAISQLLNQIRPPHE
ncbi:response regulator [Bradyrhizobium diazoefficiens]|nr:response regulator [Bradyrhizobium diazoefficiens]QQO21002.1 response regulator [Bradyrhizobium diazoefficiens]